MAFDLHFPDDSPATAIVRRMAEAERITPDQAAARLVLEAAKLRGTNPPAEEIWGAFSSPEDAAVWEKATTFIQERRQQDALRDFGL